MSGENLKALNAWRECRDSIEQQCMNVLETFSTVNQMAELWPEIMPFVPSYVINPSKEFELP